MSIFNVLHPAAEGNGRGGCFLRAWRPSPVRPRSSEQLQAPEAGVALAADDQMIVNHDAERLAEADDLHGHRDVGGGRARVAGRMVVHQDQRCGPEFERAAHDLARIDRRVIDRANALHLVGDELVLLIEEEDAEFPLSRTY